MEWEKKLKIKHLRNHASQRPSVKIMKLLALHCVYCGIFFSDHPLKKKTLEHIIPLCQGGSNEDENLTVVCEQCNRLKSRNDDPNQRIKFNLPSWVGKRRKRKIKRRQEMVVKEYSLKSMIKDLIPEKTLQKLLEIASQ